LSDGNVLMRHGCTTGCTLFSTKYTSGRSFTLMAISTAHYQNIYYVMIEDSYCV